MGVIILGLSGSVGINGSCHGWNSGRSGPCTLVHSQGLSHLLSPSINQPFLPYLSSLPSSYVFHSSWLSNLFPLLISLLSCPPIRLSFPLGPFLPPCLLRPLLPKLPATLDPCFWSWMHIRNCVGCASVAELQSHRRTLALGLTKRRLNNYCTRAFQEKVDVEAHGAWSTDCSSTSEYHHLLLVRPTAPVQKTVMV